MIKDQSAAPDKILRVVVVSKAVTEAVDVEKQGYFVLSFALAAMVGIVQILRVLRIMRELYVFCLDVMGTRYRDVLFNMYFLGTKYNLILYVIYT